MVKHLVVARYNENITWVEHLRNVDNVYIYDKGKPTPTLKTSGIFYENLPNIGRESHTYLHHIIKYYYELPDILVTCQGYPFDHCPGLIKILACHDLDEIWEVNKLYHQHNSLRYPGFIGLGTSWTASTDIRGIQINRLIHKIWYSVKQAPIPPAAPASWGAILVLSRWLLLRKPLTFYRTLFDIHMEEFASPWAMELMWQMLLCEQGKECNLKLL